MKKIARALSALAAVLSTTAFSLTALADDGATTAETSFWSDFPWARVITLVVIVILIVVAIILAKTNTALGQRINKFFKEYWSEIKKVSWYSPKDTAKATGLVLVFLVVAAIAIGLLDFGFTKLIQLLANIF